MPALLEEAGMKLVQMWLCSVQEAVSLGRDRESFQSGQLALKHTDKKADINY